MSTSHTPTPWFIINKYENDTSKSNLQFRWAYDTWWISNLFFHVLKRVERMNENLHLVILGAWNKTHLGFNIFTSDLPYSSVNRVHPVKKNKKKQHDITSESHSLRDDVISRAGHLSGEVTLGSTSKRLPGRALKILPIDTIKQLHLEKYIKSYMAGHAASPVFGKYLSKTRLMELHWAKQRAGHFTRCP